MALIIHNYMPTFNKKYSKKAKTFANNNPNISIKEILEQFFSLNEIEKSLFTEQFNEFVEKKLNLQSSLIIRIGGIDGFPVIKDMDILLKNVSEYFNKKCNAKIDLEIIKAPVNLDNKVVIVRQIRPINPIDNFIDYFISKSHIENPFDSKKIFETCIYHIIKNCYNEYVVSNSNDAFIKYINDMEIKNNNKINDCNALLKKYNKIINYIDTRNITPENIKKLYKYINILIGDYKYATVFQVTTPNRIKQFIKALHLQLASKIKKNKTNINNYIMDNLINNEFLTLLINDNEFKNNFNILVKYDCLAYIKEREEFLMFPNKSSHIRYRNINNMIKQVDRFFINVRLE